MLKNLLRGTMAALTDQILPLFKEAAWAAWAKLGGMLTGAAARTKNTIDDAVVAEVTSRATFEEFWAHVLDVVHNAGG